jgi:hypothetical protein
MTQSSQGIEPPATPGRFIPASDGDRVYLTSPDSTQYTSSVCTNCTQDGLSHSQAYTGRPYEAGVWSYVVESSRDGCTGKRTSDAATFVAWRVTQSSVGVSYEVGSDDSLMITASWSTDYSATAGDSLVLTSPSNQHYSSPLCTNCTGNGTSHSVTYGGAGKCEGGKWYYVVSSSRGGANRRQSQTKYFWVNACIE